MSNNISEGKEAINYSKDYTFRAETASFTAYSSITMFINGGFISDTNKCNEKNSRVCYGFLYLLVCFLCSCFCIQRYRVCWVKENLFPKIESFFKDKYDILFIGFCTLPSHFSCCIQSGCTSSWLSGFTALCSLCPY